MNTFKRCVWVCGALIAGLSALAIALAFFQPPPPAVQDSRPVPAYWSFDTGSRIAYWHFPARGNAKRIPVIVLHGGPGTSTRAVMLNDFPQAFTARGYDVYFYDQAGSGASARLADPSDYTLARMVADLDAIRLTLGAEKVLLVANSWGAVIAGRYAAAHPAQVAGIGLLSPGPMDSIDQQRPDFSQSNRGDTGWPPSPRMMAAVALLQWSPHWAQRFMSQDEAGQWAASYIGAQASGSFDCKSATPAQPLALPGANLYPHVLLQRDFQRAAPILPTLSGLQIPAIVFRGECDFLPRVVAERYAAALKLPSIHDVAHEGHGLSTGLRGVATLMVQWFSNMAPELDSNRSRNAKSPTG